MSLPSVMYGSGANRRVVFELPPAPQNPSSSVLALSMPKAGSVLLDRVLRDLAPHVNLTYVSIMEAFFNEGVADNDIPPETSKTFLPEGYCYGGFRTLPPFDIPIMPSARKMLLVRDPRDMLTSLYFSLVFSHPEPTNSEKDTQERATSRTTAKATAIDEFVLEAGASADAYNAFCDLCRDQDIAIFRYEDIVFEKAQWVADICTHFGWNVGPEIRAEIAARHDIVPSVEDHTQHVRQVSPGDHARKLKPETISILNERFAEPMTYFGYTP